MAGQKSNTHQRELGYRAVIPFYILWDTDLNGNDLRFYGQIEQFESNPNPDVGATFSYQWIADMLGINRRNAINIANKLKKKGYITRTKINEKDYLWNTVKKGVLVSSSDTPLVSHNDTPLVSSSDTQNTSKLKTNNEIKDLVESVDSTPTNEITNKEFVEVFIEECLCSPHPRNPDNPSKDAIRSFNALRKTWRTEISKSGKALTKESFRGLLQDMKENKSWLVNPDKKVHIDLLCQPKWVIKFLEERAAKGQS